MDAFSSNHYLAPNRNLQLCTICDRTPTAIDTGIQSLCKRRLEVIRDRLTAQAFAGQTSYIFRIDRILSQLTLSYLSGKDRLSSMRTCRFFTVSADVPPVIVKQRILLTQAMRIANIPIFITAPTEPISQENYRILQWGVGDRNYPKITKCYTRIGEINSALSLLSQIKGFGANMTISTIKCSIIHELGRQRAPAYAKELIDTFDSDNKHLLLKSLVSGLIEGGHLELASLEIKAAQDEDLISSLSVAYSRAGSRDKARLLSRNLTNRAIILKTRFAISIAKNKLDDSFSLISNLAPREQSTYLPLIVSEYLYRGNLPGAKQIAVTIPDLRIREKSYKEIQLSDLQKRMATCDPVLEEEKISSIVDTDTKVDTLMTIVNSLERKKTH